jgi:NADH-quinone oxidoreductase subunit D
VSTTNPPLPEFDIDPRAFRHLADAQVGVELDTGDMILNLGPQHPATHGTLRLVVRLDGERVISADPVIGYMHRGYEKLTEFRTYPQITTLINRIDWLSSFANEVPFIDAAEQLMGIQAPPRAQYIRTILTELSRIATFVLFLGEMGLQVGALTPASPMAVDAEASVVLTLTAPDWGAADEGYQGATGDLTVQFTGTTEAP